MFCAPCPILVPHPQVEEKALGMDDLKLTAGVMSHQAVAVLDYAEAVRESEVGGDARLVRNEPASDDGVLVCRAANHRPSDTPFPVQVDVMDAAAAVAAAAGRSAWDPPHGGAFVSLSALEEQLGTGRVPRGASGRVAPMPEAGDTEPADMHLPRRVTLYRL